MIKDLRSHYEENKVERVSREKYPIEGKVRPIVLQNRFNALVLKLEDNLSNEEILTHKDNYIEQQMLGLQKVDIKVQMDELFSS